LNPEEIADILYRVGLGLSQEYRNRVTEVSSKLAKSLFLNMLADITGYSGVSGGHNCAFKCD
jgi:hypothetical protein